MKSIKALTPVATNAVPVRAMLRVGLNLPKAAVQGKVSEGNSPRLP